MFTRSGSLSVSAIHIPKIIISQVALEKMKAFVEYCDKEIGWLGTATLSNNTITLHDMFLFEQEAHATTCEIDEKAVAKWYEDVLGNYDNGVDIVNTMRVWGHSHVNMGVSPSGQDDKQFSELASGVTDFFIRIIANKKGELRLDYYDVVLGIVFYNVEWYQNLSVDVEAIKEEIKNKVKTKVYTYQQPQTGSRVSYYNSNKDDKEPQTPSYNAYDWYDEYYDSYGESDTASITSWKQVTSAQELMRNFGFNEDDIIKISELVTPASVIEYLKEENIDKYATHGEAKHLINLANQYVYMLYGAE